MRDDGGFLPAAVTNDVESLLEIVDAEFHGAVSTLASFDKFDRRPVQRGHGEGFPAARTGTPKLGSMQRKFLFCWMFPDGALARMLIHVSFDRDSRDTGPAETENVGGASRDIDDSALDERSPVTDH